MATTFTVAWWDRQPSLFADEEGPQTGLMSFSRKNVFDGIPDNHLSGVVPHLDWDSVTLSIVASFSSMSSEYGLIGEWEGSDFSCLIFLGSSTLSASVRRQSGSPTDLLVGYPKTNLNLNQAYHVVATYDGDKLDLYVDNVLVASDTWSGGSTGQLINNAPGNFLIGRYSTSNPFSGILDEPAIFNAPFTAEEVEELYNNGKVLDARQHSKSNLLRGYWQNSEINGKWLELSKYTDGSTGYDADMYISGTLDSILLQEGIDSGYDSFGTRLGRPRAGEWINQEKDSYAVVPTNSDIFEVFNGGASVEFWMKPYTAGNNGNNSHVFAIPSADIYLLNYSGNTVSLRLKVAHDTTSGIWTSDLSVIDLGRWNHVVVVYDSSETSVLPIFYVNGVAVAVSESTAPVGALTTDLGQSLYLGQKLTLNRDFDGAIDEVRIYDRKLSLEETQHNFNAQRQDHNV